MKMNLQERLDAFVLMGWTYNSLTGEIKSQKGHSIKGISMKMYIDKYNYITMLKHTFAWYVMTNKIPTQIVHLDNDPLNLKFDNLALLSDVPYEKKEYKARTKHNKVTKSIYIPPTKRQPKYINDTELTYEVIISLGKGYRTKKLEIMLIKIANEIIKKFTYKCEEDREDCLSNAYLMLFTGWKSFDPNKYSNAFSYVSEIAKRGLAYQFGQLRGKNANSGITPSMISLSGIHNF